MTNTTRIRLITAAITLAGTIMAFGDRISGVGLPGWLVQYWPLIYGIALAFSNVAHALWPDAVPAKGATEPAGMDTIKPPLPSQQSAFGPTPQDRIIP